MEHRHIEGFAECDVRRQIERDVERGLWGNAGAKRCENGETSDILSLILAVFGLGLLVVGRGCGRIGLFLWASSGHGREGK